MPAVIEALNSLDTTQHRGIQLSCYNNELIMGQVYAWRYKYNCVLVIAFYVEEVLLNIARSSSDCPHSIADRVQFSNFI